VALAWLQAAPRQQQTVLQQLQDMGATADVLAAWQAQQAAQPQQQPVWPQHWHALHLLQALSTQWRWLITHAGGRRQGLRYEAITPLLLRMVADQVPQHLRQPAPRLLGQLQHMERAVINHQNQQA